MEKLMTFTKKMLPVIIGIMFVYALYHAFAFTTGIYESRLWDYETRLDFSAASMFILFIVIIITVAINTFKPK